MILRGRFLSDPAPSFHGSKTTLYLWWALYGTFLHLPSGRRLLMVLVEDCEPRTVAHTSNNDKVLFFYTFLSCSGSSLVLRVQSFCPSPSGLNICSLGKHIRWALWFFHSNCAPLLQAYITEEDYLWALALTLIFLMRTQWRSVEKSWWGWELPL